MSSKNAMKKFGRGYVLDFTALMDEVGPGSQQSSTATTNTSTTSGTTALSPDSDHHSPPRRADSTAEEFILTPSPSEEDPPAHAELRMKRMPARMSVSRTGRCKNKDRKRISVLQTAEFYSMSTSPSIDIHASEHKNASDRGIVIAKSTATTTASRPTDGKSAELDSAMNALDISHKAPYVTDCYSF